MSCHGRNVIIQLLLISLNLKVVAGIVKLDNRPLPSSKNPHFQNEAKCTTFLVKMSFTYMRMKNHFHIKGWTLNLVLIQRPGATRKWPTAFCARCLPYGLKKVYCNDFSMRRNRSRLSASPHVRQYGSLLLSKSGFPGLGYPEFSSTNPESKFHWQRIRKPRRGIQTDPRLRHVV